MKGGLSWQPGVSSLGDRPPGAQPGRARSRPPLLLTACSLPCAPRRILLNYAVYNPAIGYFQGMSDLVAPILAEVLDESDTFWCFVGLMQNTIFVSSPRDEDMEKQLVRLGTRVTACWGRGACRLLPSPPEISGAACVVAAVGPQAERPGWALPMSLGA